MILRDSLRAAVKTIMARAPTIRLPIDQEEAVQDDLQLSNIETIGWHVAHTLRDLSDLLHAPIDGPDLDPDAAAKGIAYLARLAAQMAHLREPMAIAKSRIEQHRSLIRKVAKSRAAGARSDFLTPFISRAVTQHGDDPAQVFMALRQLAQETPPRPPFFGVSNEGLQWLDASDNPQTLTLKALRERLRRRATAR